MSYIMEKVLECNRNRKYNIFELSKLNKVMDTHNQVKKKKTLNIFHKYFFHIFF